MTGTTSSRKFSYNIGLHDIPFNNAAWFWAIAVMKTWVPGKNPGRTENETGRILTPRFEKLCSTQQAHIYHYNLFWVFKNEIQMFSFFPFVLIFFPSILHVRTQILINWIYSIVRSFCCPWNTMKKCWGTKDIAHGECWGTFVLEHSRNSLLSPITVRSLKAGATLYWSILWFFPQQHTWLALDTF